MTNRFKDLFEVANDNTPADRPKKSFELKVAAEPVTIQKVIKPKRPAGKSSNPDFTQALTYLKITTYNEVKRSLIDLKGTDFSDLVEQLLTDWLKKRNK